MVIINHKLEHKFIDLHFFFVRFGFSFTLGVGVVVRLGRRVSPL